MVKIIFEKSKEISKIKNLNSHLCNDYTAQLMQRSSRSVLHYHELCLNHWIICCFPVLTFVKKCLPKSKWYHKSKVKKKLMCLSDKLKNFKFIERQHVFSRSWAALWEKRIKHPHCRTILNSLYPEHVRFFFNGGETVFDVIIKVK
jgi:hypothetical protein